MGGRLGMAELRHSGGNLSTGRAGANDYLDLGGRLRCYKGFLTACSILPSRPTTMSDGKAIEVEGKIVAVLPGTMFRVELENKHVVLATICGKMRKRWVRLTVGDRVKMEMSPYDLNKARITWRLK